MQSTTVHVSGRVDATAEHAMNNVVAPDGEGQQPTQSSSPQPPPPPPVPARTHSRHQSLVNPPPVPMQQQPYAPHAQYPPMPYPYPPMPYPYPPMPYPYPPGQPVSQAAQPPSQPQAYPGYPPMPYPYPPMPYPPPNQGEQQQQPQQPQQEQQQQPQAYPGYPPMPYPYPPMAYPPTQQPNPSEQQQHSQASQQAYPPMPYPYPYPHPYPHPYPPMPYPPQSHDQQQQQQQQQQHAAYAPYPPQHAYGQNPQTPPPSSPPTTNLPRQLKYLAQSLWIGLFLLAVTFLLFTLSLFAFNLISSTSDFGSSTITQEYSWFRRVVKVGETTSSYPIDVHGDITVNGESGPVFPDSSDVNRFLAARAIAVFTFCLLLVTSVSALSVHQKGRWFAVPSFLTPDDIFHAWLVCITTQIVSFAVLANMLERNDWYRYNEASVRLQIACIVTSVIGVIAYRYALIGVYAKALEEEAGAARAYEHTDKHVVVVRAVKQEEEGVVVGGVPSPINSAIGSGVQVELAEVPSSSRVPGPRPPPSPHPDSARDNAAGGHFVDA